MFEGAKPKEGVRAAGIPSDLRQGAHPQEGVRAAAILWELRLSAHPHKGGRGRAPLLEGVRTAAILWELWQGALPPEGVHPATPSFGLAPSNMTSYWDFTLLRLYFFWRLCIELYGWNTYIEYMHKAHGSNTQKTQIE